MAQPTQGHLPDGELRSLRLTALSMVEVSLPERDRPYVVIRPTAGKPEPLEDFDLGLFESLYRAHGALVFRGFGAGLASFRTFVRSFCPTAAINETPDRKSIDRVHAIQSVSGGVGRFELHPELSREPWRPDTACFLCLSAPSSGGATTVCDGVALARALPADLSKELAKRRLVYVMSVWPELLRFWLGTDNPDENLLSAPPPSCPYSFMRLHDGRIARYFSRPALHKPMFTNDLAFGNFLLFARFNNGRSDFPLLDSLRPVPEAWLQTIRAAGDALSSPVQWCDGDVMVLDNTRFMHGRTPIHNQSERLIATYFGYLNFAVRDPEEIIDPPWRRADFTPPEFPQ